MRLALDHHVSFVVALRLREAGHDVVSAAERGWELEDEESLLRLCTGERRVLLTDEVADFTAICGMWAADGQTHAGLIFASGAGIPDSRRTIGRFVDALADFLRRHPEEDALRDRVHWL